MAEPTESGWRAFYIVIGARECGDCGCEGDQRMWEHVTLEPGPDGLGVETVNEVLCHGCSPFAGEAYPVGDAEDETDLDDPRDPPEVAIDGAFVAVDLPAFDDPGPADHLADTMAEVQS